MRRDMIAESRLAWQKFDEEMKKLEQQKSFSALEQKSTLDAATEDCTTTNKKGEEVKNIIIESSTTPSWFSPMKLVRFPSLFDENLQQRTSLFKEENVIKVTCAYGSFIEQSGHIWPFFGPDFCVKFLLFFSSKFIKKINFDNFLLFYLFHFVSTRFKNTFLPKIIRRTLLLKWSENWASMD